MLAITVVLLFALGLATGIGQRLALHVTAWVLTDARSGVSFGALSGSLLSEGTIDRIDVTDERGVWLEIRDVAFSWNPGAFAKGQLDISYLVADAATVLRLPMASDGDTSINPDLPFAALAVRRLEVRQLQLTEAVAGQAATFKIAAAADIVDHTRGLSASMRMERLDGIGGNFNAHFAYGPNGQTLQLTAAASEPQGGVVAHLLDIPGRPPLSLTVSGTGPLDSWRAEWAASTASQPFVVGTVEIDRDGPRHRFRGNMAGYLETILPAPLTGLLAGKTTVSIAGHVNGLVEHALLSVEVSQGEVVSDAILLTASGAYDVASLFLTGTANLKVVRADGQPVKLESKAGDGATLHSAELTITLPDQLTTRSIMGSADVRGIAGAFGSVGHVAFKIEATQETATGKSALAAQNIKASAAITGFYAADATAAQTLATDATAKLTGDLRANTLTVSALEIATAGGRINASGALGESAANGSASLDVPDLSLFSGLAGRKLAGRLSMISEFDFDLDEASGRLSLQGNSDGVQFDVDAVDQLLAPTTKFSGSVAADRNGSIVVDKLTVANPNLFATFNGGNSGKTLNVQAHGKINDLAKLDTSLSGAATFNVSLGGSSAELSSKASITGTGISLKGRAFSDPAVKFSGHGSLSAHDGKLVLSGRFGDEPVTGAASIAVATDGSLSIDDLEFKYAGARANGQLQLRPGAEPAGKFDIDVPRLASLTALTGQELSGSISAHVELAANDGHPVASVRASSKDLGIGDIRISGAKVEGQLRDYLQELRAELTAHVASVDSTDAQLRNLKVVAHDDGGRTQFQSSGTINTNPFAFNGSAVQQGPAFVIELSSASLRAPGTNARLDGAAKISLQDGGARLDRLSIDINGGRAVVDGRASEEALDLTVGLDNIPASIADAYDASLGLGGNVNGRIKLYGTPADPAAEAVLKWQGASARVLRDENLPPLTIDADAKLAGATVTTQIGAVAAGGFKASATGTIAAKQDGPINVRISGEIPLALANGAVAERGIRLSGVALAATELTGSLSKPKASGTVRLNDATLSDPKSGLSLVGINGAATLSGTTLTVDSLSGTSAKGGTFSAQGKLSIDDADAAAADIGVTLASLKFDDRELMSGELDGTVRLTGPLRSLLIGGDIVLKRLDVTVPSQLPRSIASLDIKHVNAPQELNGAGDKDGLRGESSLPSQVSLDMTLSAANRIFVKGRGLDAQLGGRLRLRGTAAAPAAEGKFTMERGRLSIVGRQLDFSRGNLFFESSVEPSLDMEAASTFDGTTVSVLVTGPASKPVFRFASSPALPEDEAVARLLFNKSLAKLSPLQLAQLASEIDKIGGLSTGPGTIDQLKDAIGVDVFDVSTDGEGGASVSAGSYLNEKTYVGAKQGTSANSSRIVIDHDLTKNLKARGELGADGNSKLGIGVEWDY